MFTEGDSNNELQSQLTSLLDQHKHPNWRPSRSKGMPVLILIAKNKKHLTQHNIPSFNKKITKHTKMQEKQSSDTGMTQMLKRKRKITRKLICKGSNEKRQTTYKINCNFTRQMKTIRKKSNINSRNQKHRNSDEYLQKVH